MWQHINHNGFWLIDLDNLNLHRESSDLHLWIVLSARVQNVPPPLLRSGANVKGLLRVAATNPTILQLQRRPLISIAKLNRYPNVSPAGSVMHCP